MELTLKEIEEQIEDLEVMLACAEKIDPVSYNSIVNQLKELDELYIRKLNEKEGDVR